MNFIINLNKPPGMTSQQAVTRVKRLFAAKKAGHTGTLDPMATGVLLVCLNEATKISRFFLEMDKKYKARIKLGERTDTYDALGTVTETKDTSFLTEDEVSREVMTFAGRIMQKPPMYSAVKIGGETLYKLARKGIEIERPERPVEIYDLKITEINLPYLDVDISCSKGTYIRTLCDDIGMKLGTGAHLAALQRTGIGFFNMNDSANIDELMSESLDNNQLLLNKRFFCSIDNALSGLPEIILCDSDYRKAQNGVPVISDEITGLPDNKFIRLKGPSGNLFGIGKKNSGIIKIERILNL